MIFLDTAVQCVVLLVFALGVGESSAVAGVAKSWATGPGFHLFLGDRCSCAVQSVQTIRSPAVFIQFLTVILTVRMFPPTMKHKVFLAIFVFSSPIRVSISRYLPKIRITNTPISVRTDNYRLFHQNTR